MTEAEELELLELEEEEARLLAGAQEPAQPESGPLGFESIGDAALSFGKRLYAPTAVDESLKDLDYLVSGRRPTSGQQLAAKAQGASLGFGDEFVGAAGGLASAALDGENLGEAYRSTRDAVRDELADASAASPVSQLAGGVAVPLPGPGKATGLAKLGANIGIGAGAGALSGAGLSDADLTRGEGEEFVTEVGRMAALGGGTAGLTTGAGMALGAVRRGLTGVANRAADEVLGAERAAFEAEQNQLRGALGGQVQKGNRMAENLRRLDAPLEVPEAAALNRLENRLIAANRRALPGQVAAIDDADAAYRAAMDADVDQVAAQRAAARMAQGGDRLQGVLAKALLGGAGAIVGGAVGGIPGALIGAVSGAGGGAAGSALRGVAKDPVARHRAASTLEMLLRNPQRFGKYAAPLLDAASRGQQAFEVVDFTLQQQEEGYRDLLREDEP